jgi:hypothetical protein
VGTSPDVDRSEAARFLHSDREVDRRRHPRRHVLCSLGVPVRGDAPRHRLRPLRRRHVRGARARTTFELLPRRRSRALREGGRQTDRQRVRRDSDGSRPQRRRTRRTAEGTRRSPTRHAAYESCLRGFGVPPPPPPSEQELRRGNVRVAVPHLQGVRVTRKVIGGVYHYFVVADSPRRLLKEGWMTPLFDSVDFRSKGAHPVRVHLYTSSGRLLFSAGRGSNGLTSWMHIYRYRFVPCGPVWYALGRPQTLTSRLMECPQKPRLVGR